MENNLTPYVISIKETYVKTVIVYGEDQFHAEEIADELCGGNKITFDCENFTDRTTECKGRAIEGDFSLFEVHGAPEETEKRETLDQAVSSATARAAEQQKHDPVARSAEPCRD